MGRVWRKRYFSESSLRSQEIYRPGIGYVWRNYPASLLCIHSNSNDRWLLIQRRNLKELASVTSSKGKETYSLLNSKRFKNGSYNHVCTLSQ